MSKLIFLSTIILCIGLGSCAFNKQFYQPDTTSVETPPDATSIYLPYGEKQDSIHCFLYERSAPIASIFFLHGNAGNLAGWSGIADLFYQAGYQVFILDYPGFGNSSGETTHLNVQLATQKAVDFFNNHPKIEPTKKLLAGFSLGGNLALKISFDNPTLFNAMLIEGAFSNHKDIAASGFPYLLRFLPRTLVKNTIKGDQYIQAWNKPLLIIHSEDDWVCPFEHGEKLLKNAIQTDDKELWRIKGPHLAGIAQQPEVYLYKVKRLIEGK